MNTVPRSMVILGLLIIVLGFAYGLGYTYLVEHATLLELKDGYAGDFLRMSQQKIQQGQIEPSSVEAVAATGEKSVLFRRAVGAHTHAVNLGLVVIILGPIFSVSLAGWKRGHWVARLFIAGAFTYPLGLAVQAWGWTLAGEVLAVIGSSIVVTCLVVLLWGLITLKPGINE